MVWVRLVGSLFWFLGVRVGFVDCSRICVVVNLVFVVIFCCDL